LILWCGFSIVVGQRGGSKAIALNVRCVQTKRGRRGMRLARRAAA
jgi:hypothetical protein